MKIMQQAKDMQKKMADLQERAAQFLVTGTAGNGLVEIVMSCKGQAQQVTIKPEAIDPADPTMLEDLVKTAINAARSRADETLAEETRKLMKDMGLPENAQLPGGF
jgi:DNA-binding YbaB/EbfC family protein